jgi:hypothetical protein
MSQEGSGTLLSAVKPPVSNHHYLLPLPRDKYAPKRKLTTRTRYHELLHFLQFYDHLCTHYQLTSEDEKCKGLIEYCSSGMAEKIESFPSFVQGDYTTLVENLKYFMEGEDDSYDITAIGAFTKKWRKRKVESLEHFKRYHGQYLQLLGRAKGTGAIDQKDYNRYFWEGIHYSFRKRIEKGLLAQNPRLDLTVPFMLEDVVATAKALFNKKRFDQYLLARQNKGSDTDSDEDGIRPLRVFSDSEEEEEGSEDSEGHKIRYFRKKPNFSPPPKFRQVSNPPSARNNKKDEIGKLAEQMSQLRLYLMKKDSETRNLPGNPDRSQRNGTQNNNFTRNSFPGNRPPFNNLPFQNGRPQAYYPPTQPTAQVLNTTYPTPPSRDVPPHLNQKQPSGIPTQEPYCFGCGQVGHQIRQCSDINTLLNQGTIIRNGMGKMCWSDGTYIQKNREETLMQAINRSLKRANFVRVSKHESDSEEVYQQVLTTREEDDASSTDQEELGWRPRTVANCYAVDRNKRVSKEARKEVLSNPPGSTQRMQKFPQAGNKVNSRGKFSPITTGSNLNSNQPGNTKFPLPLDVDQGKFEGKLDSQLVPMEIEQDLTKVPGHKETQISAHQVGTNISEITDPGAGTEEVSKEIIKGIMEQKVTLPLEPLLRVSPLMRQTFLNAMKGVRAGAYPRQGQKEKMDSGSKKVLNLFQEQPFERNRTKQKGETRDELITLAVRIGKARMFGIVDSGSQANIISEEYARESGLPMQLDGFDDQVSGMDGTPAEIVGVIPNAEIYVTNSDIRTTGRLLVLKDPAFSLLLGRPWATRNRAGTDETD